MPIVLASDNEQIYHGYNTTTAMNIDKIGTFYLIIYNVVIIMKIILSY